MADLSDHDAFKALTLLLSGEGDGAEWTASAEPSIERLRVALTAPPIDPSPLDLAVLLRQALRREYARRSFAVSPSVIVRHPKLRTFEDWGAVSLIGSNFGGEVRIKAEAWTPDWLAPAPHGGPDDAAAGEAIRRTFGAEGSEGDPFLGVIGRTSYRSPGQRAAVRAALSTPPGGTLVVALPTGEGKSMIFQLAHALGFVGDESSSGQGVTLVIVPTVALGVNHEEEAVGVCGLARPLAYQGGADAANATIAQRIAEGSQGLCFASPEAACKPLRSALRKAAEAGKLRAIVVDEAHLVDQWGTGFRTEFQELSGLQRELHALAPGGRQPRTLLLSATLTDSSLETLRALFGTGGEFASIAAVKLRPEPDYWIAQADERARTARVLEALHHAPRPVVLYVTQVEHAENWRRELQNAGFRRLRMLHGKTTREARERIVAEWRRGDIDIVIGTSAFGLGIDYPHARSVIHACVPETLDRFYQEVGRGGRDGRASLSLIVPAPSDFATAEGINRQMVISIDRGLERWGGLFGGKQMLGDRVIAVRIDGSPGASESDIDMTGDRNADWNLRTVALMARAGLLRLRGSPQPALEQPGDWLEVELLDDGHLQRSVWEERVEPVRKSAQASSERNLDLMRRFLRNCGCPAEIFTELYGADRVASSCSRCAICRSDPSQRHRPTSPGEPLAPWRLPQPPLIARLLGADGRLLVVYDPDDIGRGVSRRLGDTVERLQRQGLAKVVVIGEPPFDMDRVLRVSQTKVLFVAKAPSLAHARLPAGPELVLVGTGERIGESAWAAAEQRARILIMPEGYRVTSGHLLRDVFGGRVLTLDELQAKVAA